MRTKVILVRHGQSLGNAKRVLLGHTDLDLSELGYAQAHATAQALKDEKIDAIYSSDLLRAMNTAVPHARLRGMKVIPDVRLREVMLGRWEGHSVEEIIGLYGEKAYTEDWLGGFGTFTFPDGDRVMDRAGIFFDEVKSLCEQNEGKTLLIASNAAVLRGFFGKIRGLCDEEVVSGTEFPTNASYSVVYYENGSFTEGEFSVDAHLESVGITRFNQTE